MSYAVPAITRGASISSPPDSDSLGALKLHNLQGGIQGPTITSTMFSSDDDTITFPPDLENVRYTYASFVDEQYAPVPDKFSNSWELVIPVEVPSDFDAPKLLSLEYTLKYASTRDGENATLQSDVVLTTASLPSGVRRLKQRDNEVYRDMKNGYGPRTVKKDVAWNLVTSLGIKPQGNQGWGHYIDHQRVELGIHLTPRTSPNLYFILSVQEYPSSETVRSIAVEITSKWEDVGNHPATTLESTKPRHLRAYKTPTPGLADSRSPSPPSLYRFPQAAPVTSRVPLRPPVDVPMQAPRPEAHSRLCPGHILYERCYAPPHGCCDEVVRE